MQQLAEDVDGLAAQLSSLTGAEREALTFVGKTQPILEKGEDRRTLLEDRRLGWECPFAGWGLREVQCQDRGDVVGNLAEDDGEEESLGFEGAELEHEGKL